jgi:membrane protein required for beta-lactamase induction
VKEIFGKMKFIVILTCVAINRYWVGSHPIHTEVWFEKLRGNAWVHRLTGASVPYSQFLVVVVLPVVLTAIILWAIQDLFWGLLWMVLGFLVLGYSIGISNLEEVVRNHTLWLRKLTSEDNLEDTRSNHEQVIQQMVHDEFISVYPILFGFLVAGPAGALLYRLTQQYVQSGTDVDSEPDFVTLLIRLLDWIPVRITGLAFCAVGDFAQCMERFLEALLEWKQSAKTVLVEMSEVAIIDIEMEMTDAMHFATKAEYQLKEIADLLHRTLLFWIALIAVVTLLGWI